MRQLQSITMQKVRHSVVSKSMQNQHARTSNTHTDHNKVQELVPKLKVLYQFAMTSFLHQTKELSLK